MQKIPSLFARNHDTNGLVRNEVNPGCEWVLNGEGVATRKYDGACCMIRAGVFYKRYTLQEGNRPPIDFEPATGIDPITRKQQGWIPVRLDAPENRSFREGLLNAVLPLPDGTYELCGPKVQGNIERFERHILIPHGKQILVDCPREYHALRDYLRNRDIEGIVWHHLDGRRAKLKGTDFGRCNGRPADASRAR